MSPPCIRRLDNAKAIASLEVMVEAYDKEKIGKDRYIGGGAVSVADQMRQPSTSGTDFTVPLLTKAGKEAGTIRLEAIFAPTAPPSSSAAAGAKRDASLHDRILRKLRAASYTKNGQDHSKLFQLFDVNHDGSLTVDELASGLRKMTPVTDEEMDTVIGWFDADHNGLIDMHEFVGLLQHEDAEQQQYHHHLVNPQRPSSPAAAGGGGAGGGDQHTLAPDYAKAADLLRGTDARAAALLSRAAANQAAGQAVGQKAAGRAPALDNIYRAKSVNLLGRAARYRERKKEWQLTPAEQKALLDRVVHKLRGASYGIHGQDATGLFRMFDVNHDNELTLAELSRGIKKLIKVSSEELDVIMRSVDVNSDGVVNVEEFVAFLRPANAGDKAATKRVHDEMQAVLGAKLPAFPKGFSPKESPEAQTRRLSGGKGGAKKTEWWVGDGRGNVGSGDMGKARHTPDFAGSRGRVFGGLEESTLGLQEMGLLERVVRKLQGASYGKGAIHGQDAVGLFRHFDVNHDNELTLEELSRGIKKLIKVSSEELDVIMRSVDVNSDGVVNVEEFVAFLGSPKRGAKGSPKTLGRKNSKDPSGSLDSSLGSSPSSPVSQSAAPFYTPFADNDDLGKADEADETDEAGREADMAGETGKTSSSRSSATVPPLNFAGIAEAAHEEDSTVPEGLVQRLHRVQNVDTTTARTVPVVGQLAVVVRRGVGLKNVGSMLHKMAPYVKVEAAWAMESWQSTKAVVKGHSSPTWNGPSTPSADTLVFPFAAQAQAVAAARKCDSMTYELQVEVWDKGKTAGKDRFIGAGTASVSEQMLSQEELGAEIEVQLMTRPKVPKASRKGKASKSKSKPPQAAGSVFLVATFVPLPASNVEAPDSGASSPCSSSNESSEGEDSQGEVMSLAALAAQPLEGGSPHGSSSSFHSSTHGSPGGASPPSPARHVSFKGKQSPASPAPSSSPLSLSGGEGAGGQVQFQDAQSALSHDLFGPGGQAEKKQKGWQRARAGTGYRRAPPPAEDDDEAEEAEVRRKARADLLVGLQQLPTGKNSADHERRMTMFNSFDPNGNGYLSLAEVQKGVRDVLKCDALFDAKPAIMRAFQAAKNAVNTKSRLGADFVERAEFRALLVFLQRYFELYAMFKRVDSGADHRINQAEFAAALPLLAEWGLDVHDPAATFASIDRNGGGEILFDEFCDWALAAVATDAGDWSKATTQVGVAASVPSQSRTAPKQPMLEAMVNGVFSDNEEDGLFSNEDADDGSDDSGFDGAEPNRELPAKRGAAVLSRMNTAVSGIQVDYSGLEGVSGSGGSGGSGDGGRGRVGSGGSDGSVGSDSARLDSFRQWKKEKNRRESTVPAEVDVGHAKSGGVIMVKDLDTGELHPLGFTP